MSDPPAALMQYIDRLNALAGTDPAPLLAHAYVRYLGDLSGGQFIRRRLAKAYNLEDGAGLSFYDFKQLSGSGSSTIGDMKKIKEWYRDGMNAGVGDDPALKAAIVEEANLAFELNSGLFTTLRAPSAPTSLKPAAPPLGEPLTPTTEVSKSVFVAPELESPNEASYRVSAVVALIVALSLSHFIMVVGGFTGQSGSNKLEVFQLCLWNMLSRSSE